VGGEERSGLWRSGGRVCPTDGLGMASRVPEHSCSSANCKCF